MIDELVVHNLGLIESARIEPGDGLTVITGETGTGKTLLLGALRMLLGETTNPDLVGPADDETRVDGRFLTPDGHEIAAARRMPRDGRSRSYLDGRVASAAALDEATSGLVDIIGQHDQLTLTRPAEARRLVDHQLDEGGTAALGRYRSAWESLQGLLERQRALGGDLRALERERDLADHQSEEIAGAGFRAGDEAELEVTLARLRHAAEIGEHLGEAMDAAGRAREAFATAVSSVRRAERLDPSLGDLSAELDGVEATLGELGIAMADHAEGLDSDPRSLDEAERRAAVLGDLRRKYGSTLEEILAFGKRAAERSRELTELLASSERIEDEITAARDLVVSTAGELTACRRRAGDRLAAEAVGHLVDLGFRDPVLEVSIEAIDPGPSGGDRITLLFASDARLSPGDLSKVASGGELSRLVLALRLAGGAGASHTLVFDEIDAGVGGSTAIEIGRKLADLATDHQVLCVTHLPQVAAFADGHLVVDRDGATAAIRAVEDEDRIEELARMLSGAPDSTASRTAAVELLESAR